MVFGEGVAALVLGATPDVASLFTVDSSAVTTSSGSLSSLMAPDQMAQEEAIEAAQPDGVTALHVHGVGQQVADLSELLVFRNTLDMEGLVLLNHKANIGHTLAASGLIAVLASVSAMSHQIGPAHRQLERPLKLLAGVVPVQTALLNPTRRVSVHGHAVSGVNVHLVIGCVANTCATGGRKVAWRHTRDFPLHMSGPSGQQTQVTRKHGVVTSETFVDKSKREVAIGYITQTAEEAIGVASLDADEDMWQRGMKSSSAPRLLATLMQVTSAELPRDFLWKHVTANAIYDGIERCLRGEHENVAVPCAMLETTQSMQCDPLALPLCRILGVTFVSLLTFVPAIPAFAVGSIVNNAFPDTYFRDLSHEQDTYLLSAALTSVCVLPVAVMVFAAATFAQAVAVKWVLLGRYQSGALDLSSAAFGRWWLFHKLFGFAPKFLLVYFTGTLVIKLYYRLLGVSC